MLTREWSTDTIPAAGRLSQWRAAVCDGIVGAETENPEPGDFFARMAVARGRDFGFATFASSAHEVIRPARMIRGGGEAPFLVSLQLSGESRYGEGGAQMTVRRGEIALVNTARPFRVTFPSPVSRVIAIVPQALLRPRVPWCAALTAMKLDDAVPAVDLIRAHLAAAARYGTAIDHRTASMLVENVTNLLALAVESEPGMAAGHRAARRDALRAYLARNLSDPALSPRRAAAALGISVRLVHRLFEEQGTSFGRWMLERRLEACRRALEDPTAARPISDIAFAWGFNELSHFSRAFKARYGVAPRAYRATASHDEV